MMGGDLNGVVVIDKPAGVSSAKVVAIVKRLLQAEKTGHAGTLDPFATGVLICCLNRATRLAPFFLGGHKVYEAVLALGIDTDTQDGTGTVLSTCEVTDISEQKIRSVIQRFKGKIDQKPPVFSALKHKGVPLYKLARSGRPVQKPARSVWIESIEISAIALPEIHFTVSCPAGTYIRTLCADIGAALGCGGHLKSLRRTESSGFSIREAVSLSELESLAASGDFGSRFIRMADALRGMPVLEAGTALAVKVRYGQTLTDIDLAVDKMHFADGFIKIVDSENRLLAVVDLNRKDRMIKYNCVFHY